MLVRIRDESPVLETGDKYVFLEAVQLMGRKSREGGSHSITCGSRARQRGQKWSKHTRDGVDVWLPSRITENVAQVDTIAMADFDSILELEYALCLVP